MSVEASQPMTIRLPASIRGRIEAIAEVTGRSPGAVVRDLIEHDLARLEWEADVLERARAARAGEVAITSAAEMDRILGLEGVAPASDALDSIE